jgi:hypothetical protein
MKTNYECLISFPLSKIHVLGYDKKKLFMIQHKLQHGSPQKLNFNLQISLKETLFLKIMMSRKNLMPLVLQN